METTSTISIHLDENQQRTAKTMAPSHKTGGFPFLPMQRQRTTVRRSPDIQLPTPRASSPHTPYRQTIMGRPRLREMDNDRTERKSRRGRAVLYVPFLPTDLITPTTYVVLRFVFLPYVSLLATSLLFSLPLLLYSGARDFLGWVNSGTINLRGNPINWAALESTSALVGGIP